MEIHFWSSLGIQRSHMVCMNMNPHLRLSHSIISSKTSNKFKFIAWNSSITAQLKQIGTRSISSSLSPIKSSKKSTFVNSNGDGSEEKGTVVGAVALIIGTSIGSGILALPKETSPAGFIPSATCMIICWVFLMVEALLLAEINVYLWKKKKKRKKEKKIINECNREEEDVISFRSMAQETLGVWGANLATVTYIFLAYTSIVAYTCKSGELLSHLVDYFPVPVLGVLFTTLITFFILLGGTSTTDRVNQWLTASMIGLLVVIELMVSVVGGWSGMMVNTADWEKIPSTVPVIIFSLVYHDIAPVICAYLGGDLARIRLSLFLGSIVPLFSLIIWDAIALGLSSNSDTVDPVDMLLSGGWSGISPIVEAFSILAVGTSLIGTLLGFSQFFLEQLNNINWDSSSAQAQEKFGGRVVDEDLNVTNDVSKEWWRNNKHKFTAAVMAVAPTLLVSTTIPDAFSLATDVAGGYCMTILYGVLPPAMAWTIQAQLSFDDKGNNNNNNNKVEDESEVESGMVISDVKPALIGVGVFAGSLVIEQVLLDLVSILHL